ncbi:WecB/TagA/CpsF family glycosyltransferase [Candidatus Gracilibacteria bacterium]|nr:WecB/TagA/CpsF family glycosyltransferase [Candidatus Gracilibacteria bacterium]
MNIGFDARFYSPSATGIGRHIAEVLNVLGKLDDKNKYTVFLNEKNFDNFIPPSVNFRTEKTTASHYSFAEQTSFLRQLNKHRFDLMIFPQFNVPMLYNRPFIVTIHDLTIHLFPGKKSNPIKHFLYKKTIQNAADKAQKVLAVSQNTKKDIIEHLAINPEKITVVGNGISQNFQKCSDPKILEVFRTKYNLPKKYFLYTGVMRTHKNILGLVKAFSIFHQKNLEIELVLAGPKDNLYFPEILARVQTLGIEKWVHFTGFFPEEDFSKLFSAATAFIFPSFYEGFGIPPLEAMRVNLPVACAHTSSLPEVCETAALYFDPNRPEDISQKMEDILNPKIRKDLIEKGQSQWKKFSWNKVGTKYFEAINNYKSKQIQTISILDIPISTLTAKESVEQFIQLSKGEKKHFVATPNAEIILESQKNPTLKKYLKSCSLNFPDSASLLWAGEYQIQRWCKFQAFFELLLLPFRKNAWRAFPQRVTGSDSFEKICHRATQENLSIALIGGSKGVGGETAQKLRENLPGIKIQAHIDGLPFTDFWKESVLQKLEGAQIIFVAFGCPKQELWIKENLEKISSARIAIGIGGSFDFYIGKLSRAPKWIQRLGLEWLFRLFQEPSRWKRIFNAVIVFPWKVFQG